MKLDQNDKDMLKVLKMNQDRCLEATEEAKALNSDAEKSISETERFIAEMEKKLGVDSSVALKNRAPVPDAPKPVRPPQKSWDELVAEANILYPEDVTINDLLTKKEYENAMRRLETINKEFSRRTGFKKVDWAFFATAVALQCVRQYILDPWIKKMRSPAGSDDEKNRKENAEPGWYHAETNKILISRVPFDAQGYSDICEYSRLF